jgi:hypothetical protein
MCTVAKTIGIFKVQPTKSYLYLAISIYTYKMKSQIKLARNSWLQITFSRHRLCTVPFDGENEHR